MLVILLLVIILLRTIQSESVRLVRHCASLYGIIVDFWGELGFRCLDRRVSSVFLSISNLLFLSYRRESGQPNSIVTKARSCLAIR